MADIEALLTAIRRVLHEMGVDWVMEKSEELEPQLRQ